MYNAPGKNTSSFCTGFIANCRGAWAYNARKAGFSIFETPPDRVFACFLVLFGDAFRTGFIAKNVVFGASRAIFDLKTRIKLLRAFFAFYTCFLVKSPPRRRPFWPFCYKTPVISLPKRSILTKKCSKTRF